MIEDSGLVTSLPGSTGHNVPLTSAERAQRYGQLAQLRDMKRNLHKMVIKFKICFYIFNNF